MTTLKTMTIAAVVVTFGHAAAAQQPPRPADSARSVTLSLTEYNRLLDLSNRPTPGPAIAPVAAVLASADLRIRVERENARGVYSLTGDVLRAGISRVNLLAGATLVDGNAAGRPLPLLTDGTAHSALLPGPGPFALTLDWGAPLTFAPGRASFVLPVPPAGTARATIDLPGDQADVHLSAGLVTHRSATGGRTVVEVTLRPGAATEVWWSMRDSAPVAAAREVRTLADVMTLVTLGASDVRMVALIDVTVVQGEPRTLDVRLPAGYELTGISGGSLETSEPRDGRVVLTVSEPAARRHQFLVTLERPHDGGSFTLDTGFLTLPDVQRERGEIAVEGVGTLDLNAAERDGMHRIDVRELNQALQSLARAPILSAFRYQRSGAAPPGLSLDVKRFADAGVLAAVADRAVATTLVTTEGRALTEVSLQIRNRAQPFLKVALPAGATMVSVEIAGEPAKPVLGIDGTRVPLLRPGFRPHGAYTVSFVYLHAGTPFARKGEFQMTLPKMDVPVGLVEWEVFVPGNYSVRAVDGNVIDRQTVSATDLAFAESTDSGPAGTSFAARFGLTAGVANGVAGGIVGSVAEAPDALPGQIRGRAFDTSGTVLPGVTVALDVGGSRRVAVTASDGTFLLSGVPSGSVTMTAQLTGFGSQSRSFVFDQQPRQVEFVLRVGGVSETVTVTGQTPALDRRANEAQKAVEPSQNVINLQRRAAGVLPVRVDVPRAGTSHQFVKPLVVDQETVVSLRYKRR
jgi:Carboxypeptidase regulatory-like domain